MRVLGASLIASLRAIGSGSDTDVGNRGVS